MPTPASDDPAAELRLVRTIVTALAGGVAVFAALAAALGPIGQPLAPVAYGLDVVALAAAAVTLGSVPLAFLLPSRIGAGAAEASPRARRQAFRGSRIVAAALLEGPALLWAVALLLSGNTWFLAPIAVLFTLILQQVPTRDAFESATGERVPRE